MDMVERVARAMCAETGIIWGGPHGEDDPDFLLMKVTYLSLARTAIAAVKASLTPEFAAELMSVGSGYLDWRANPADSDEWYGDYEDFQDGWNNAFDAALGIKKTPA